MPKRGPDLDNINITEEGVLNQLLNLKPNKASGPDGISPRFLQMVAHEITPALTLLYRASLKSGIVPQDWKLAHVTPVFKKGERYCAENYRPISLTSIPCKVMEHVIVHAITKHMEKNNLLHPEQHGFRRQRSCETQLIGLVDELTQELENGHQTDVIALDFSKAFDKVNHSLLVHKLKRYGITGAINTWIASFLSNRQQSVIVDDTVSKPIPVESGVPQGSVLGPALFLAYIDDLPDTVQSKTRLFADDTACSSTIKGRADQEQLQRDLDALTVWESRWSMAFHPKKCQVLHVKGKKKETPFHYNLHGETLQSTPQLKYLGVTLTDDLRWKTHITDISKKANNTLGFLRRNIKTVNKRIKEHAYRAFVRPLLEYSSSVWDPYYQDDIDALEKIQNRAARWVTSRYRRTSHISEIIDTLQWPSLQARREKTRLETLFKFDKGLINIESQHLPVKKPQDVVKVTTRSSHSEEYEDTTHPRLYRQKAFFPRTIVSWNKLPQRAVTATTLDLFRAGIPPLI
jgi:hypothetical protein